MRNVCPLLGLVCLIACGHGNQDKEAVRKAIEDRLAGMGMGPGVVTVQLKDVDFKGNEATANVSIVPKSTPDAGMSIPYHLTFKDNKWVATAPVSGGTHGSQSSPASMANPHGGGSMPPDAAANGASAMPSPNDLPPAAKKPGN